MDDVLDDWALYTLPSKEIIENRKDFYSLRKKRRESIQQWLERVRIQAGRCEFLKFTDYLLIDKFICELNNEEIESIRYTSTWTLKLLNESLVNRNNAIAVNATIDDPNELILIPLDTVKSEPVCMVIWMIQCYSS